MNDSVHSLVESFAGGETRASKRRGGHSYPVAKLRQGRVAKNQCVVVSAHFHSLMRELRGGGEHQADVPGATIYSVHWVGSDREHWVNVVDGEVIDWTARQFDSSTPWPLIEPLDDYLARCSDAKDYNQEFLQDYYSQSRS